MVRAFDRRALGGIDQQLYNISEFSKFEIDGLDLRSLLGTGYVINDAVWRSMSNRIELAIQPIDGGKKSISGVQTLDLTTRQLLDDQWSFEGRASSSAGTSIALTGEIGFFGTVHHSTITNDGQAVAWYLEVSKFNH